MFTQSFDARQFEPQQGFDKHPPGIFDAVISNTDVVDNKDASTGKHFLVVFTTPAGSISNRYNLWNNTPKAVEIALKELSALCYVTGVFVIPQGSKGEVLRNARCKIEVVAQKDKSGAETGYMEIKRVLDLHGNEPGRTGQAQPQQQQPQASQQAPQTQNPSGGWGAPAQQQQPTGQAPGGWQAPPQVNPPPNPPGNSWQPGPTANPPTGDAGKPPWART